MSSYGALAHSHGGKLSTHTHLKENQGYEKQEAAGKSITRYFHDLDPEKQHNLISVIHANKTYEPMRHCAVSVCSQTQFITAQCGTCTLCFGTTQDIPAGLYQPDFQDTLCLSYEATVPAKNKHTRATILTTDMSQLRQSRLIQTEIQNEKQAKAAARKTTYCFQTQHFFTSIYPSKLIL